MIGMTVCSGIGAPEVAAPWIDWRYQSEIDRFPCAVLAHRFPGATNLGDMTRFQEWPDATVDVLCGGTPCQSFSVAGLRKGLADPRGNLMLTYLAIADRFRPRWLVWENVPGVLSSNGGRDFGAFLGAMGQLGYGFAYRVLDAQFVRTRSFPFAVPQRRRRVFVVGYLGDWRRAAAVLFDGESLSGNPPPRRETGQGATSNLAARTYGGGGLGAYLDGGLIANSGPVGYCLTASAQQSLDAETETETLLAFQSKASPSNSMNPATVAPTLDKGKADGLAVAFDLNQITSATNRSQPDPAVHHTLPATSCPPHLALPWAVRRLAPVECERLQGFPDGWTDIPYRGKRAADGPRYKALGNSWAVNCGERIFDRIRIVGKWHDAR
jgi:DNA (cytosine-5)-methyltransferase 1